MLGSPIAVPETKPSADGTIQTGGHRKILPTAGLGVVPRYLAPEILTTGQYSLKSDSYSFAIILHEMLTLSKPYAAYQPGQHMIRVCIRGGRPNLPLYHFPKTLENLLHKGWKHNWNKRITVSTMCKVLANSKFTQPSTDSNGRRPSTRGMPPTSTSARPRRGRKPQRNRSMTVEQQTQGRSQSTKATKKTPLRAKSASLIKSITRNSVGRVPSFGKERLASAFRQSQ